MLKDGEIPWGKASVPAHLRHPRAPEDTRLLGSLIVRSGKGTSGVSSYASGTHERPSAVEAAGGMVMTVDTSDPSSLRRYAVKVSDAAENHAYVGRFFPVTVTRLSKFVDGQGRRKRYLSDVAVPRLTPKLAHVVVDRATGEGSTARSLILRGTAIHAKLIDYDGSNVWLNSYAEGGSSHAQSAELGPIVSATCANGGVVPPQHVQKFARLRSAQRSYLNGMSMYRAKFTSFSRHYTNAAVLRSIAKRLQPLIQPNDTFVDFACGQNSFGALLKDPGTQQPLRSVAFDIFSPAENTSDFTRRPWQSVDATSLPLGELIVGLNPPFGYLNREAIEFVEHAVCAQPRIIVLIMPATNYAPKGYTLEHMDDQLCQNWAFYAPGTNTGMRIKAAKVYPKFLIYKRIDETPLPRRGRCHHVMNQLSKVRSCKMQRENLMQLAKRNDKDLQEEMLCEVCA